MVGQVKVVAILMMAQGGLTLLMGLWSLGESILRLTGVIGTPVMPPELQGHASTIATVAGSLGLCVGVFAMASAGLNLFGGFKAMKFQSRTLVLVALFCNFLAFFTCWCIPTSLGVMIYGLIVMFNAQVAEAFKLGDQGQSPEAILAKFQTPPSAPPGAGS